MAIRGIGPGVAALLLATAAAGAADWVTPAAGDAHAGKPDARKLLEVPDARTRFTEAQITDLNRAADWFPERHPPLPAVVASGQGDRGACGYCHLPGGEGRPENASLAGLPKDYIQRQVQAIARGERTGLKPDWVPSALMVRVARATSPKDLDAAAAYFSRLSFVSHVRVVEGDVAPSAAPAHFVWARRGGGTMPLGERIIETPESMERFERRDPNVAFVAYVPAGSISRGAALAASGGPGGVACASCHGIEFHGGLGPPLAGRSPTYIARQLMAFRSGARRELEAAPMRLAAGKLTDRQVIDLAAYLASQKP